MGDPGKKFRGRPAVPSRTPLVVTPEILYPPRVKAMFHHSPARIASAALLVAPAYALGLQGRRAGWEDQDVLIVLL